MFLFVCSLLFVGAKGTITDFTFLSTWRQLARQKPKQHGSPRTHFVAMQARDESAADKELAELIGRLGQERAVHDLLKLSKSKVKRRAAFGWKEKDVQKVQEWMTDHLRAVPYGTEYSHLPDALRQLAEDAEAACTLNNSGGCSGRRSGGDSTSGGSRRRR